MIKIIKRRIYEKIRIKKNQYCVFFCKEKQRTKKKKVNNLLF